MFRLPLVPRSFLWIAVSTALLLFGGCAGSHQSLNEKPIRVLTFNIHHGVGADSTLDIRRVANVILQSDVDIVALQDVDRWVNRTGKMDMMTQLADMTGMTYTFAESSDFDSGEHGNGLLTRFPILEEKHLLYRKQVSHQECSLMRLVLDIAGTETVLMNTELNMDAKDSVRSADIAEILASAKEYNNVPIILCGCLNGAPDSTDLATISAGFVDCWTIAGPGEGFTFPADQPKDRSDYIFVSKPLVPTDTKSPEIRLRPIVARVLKSNASDHLPLLVTLKIVSE